MLGTAKFLGILAFIILYLLLLFYNFRFRLLGLFKYLYDFVLFCKFLLIIIIENVMKLLTHMKLEVL